MTRKKVNLVTKTEPKNADVVPIQTGITTDSAFTELLSIFQYNQDNFAIPIGLNGYGAYTQLFEYLYELSTLASNVVDLLPQSMGMLNPVIKYPDSTINGDLQDNVNNIIQHFIEATKISRLTGGAAILIGTTGKLDKPVDTYSKKPLFYNVLEGGASGELRIDPQDIDRNPLSETYLKPAQYRLRYSGEIIHASRVLPFYGVKPLTKRQWRINRYWGVPVLVRCYEALKNLEKGEASVATLIDKFSRLILKLEGYNELIRTPIGVNLLKEKMRQLNRAWNVDKTLLLSSGDQASNLETEFHGFIEAFESIKETFASKTDIPYGKLFNAAAKGKGLGGASSGSQSIDRGDERAWADYVQSKQVNEWNPNLFRLCDLWLGSYGVTDSEEYEIEWESIIQESKDEATQQDFTRSQTALNYVNMGAVNAQQVAKALSEDIPIGTVVATHQSDVINGTILANALNSLKANYLNVNAGDSCVTVDDARARLITDFSNGNITAYEYVELNQVLDNYNLVTNDEFVSKNSDGNYVLGRDLSGNGDEDQLNRKSDDIDDPLRILNSSKENNEELTDEELESRNSSNNLSQNVNDSQTVDDNTPPKRIIDWEGYKIALQYFPFDQRFGKTLMGGYGHIQRTLSDDGMAADVYVGTNLKSDKVFYIDQWIDGIFDERKFIIGVNNPMEARELYTTTMPASFIGGLGEDIGHKLLEATRQAYEAKYGTSDSADLLVINDYLEIDVLIGDYNENHDDHGRFASSQGSGSSSSDTESKIKPGHVSNVSKKLAAKIGADPHKVEAHLQKVGNAARQEHEDFFGHEYEHGDPQKKIDQDNAIRESVKAEISKLSAQADIRNRAKAASERPVVGKLPTGVTVVNDHGNQNHEYTFEAKGHQFEMTYKHDPKDNTHVVDFNVNGSQIKGSVDDKASRVASVKLAKIQNYHIANSPNGTVFKTSGYNGDGEGQYREGIYQRMGFSAPNGQPGTEGKMYGVVDNGKLIPSDVKGNKI